MKFKKVSTIKNFVSNNELTTSISGIYVSYKEMNLFVEFVLTDARNNKVLSQVEILNILDKLPEGSLTNVIEIKDNAFKCFNDPYISDFKYVELELDILDELTDDQDETKSYDLARHFQLFDNLNYKKVNLQKDFFQRYILKSDKQLLKDIEELKSNRSNCKILKLEKKEKCND